MDIVIHRNLMRDAMEESRSLCKRLRTSKYSDRVKVRHNGSVIEVGDICIHFRGGDVLKLAGLRPDFYNVDSFSAKRFLQQSADKCRGKELFTMGHVYDKIMEHLKIVDMYDPKRRPDWQDAMLRQFIWGSYK